MDEIARSALGDPARKVTSTNTLAFFLVGAVSDRWW
jgi:hypothetical protein